MLRGFSQNQVNKNKASGLDTLRMFANMGVRTIALDRVELRDDDMRPPPPPRMLSAKRADRLAKRAGREAKHEASDEAKHEASDAPAVPTLAQRVRAESDRVDYSRTREL